MVVIVDPDNKPVESDVIKSPEGEEAEAVSAVKWAMPEITTAEHVVVLGDNELSLRGRDAKQRVDTAVKEELKLPTEEEVQAIYDEAYAKGLAAGKEDGHAQGLAEGKQAGQSEGYAKGSEDGLATGYKEGHEKGFQEGYQAGEKEGLANGFESGEKQKVGEFEAKIDQLDSMMADLLTPIIEQDESIRQGLCQLAITLAENVILTEVKTNEKVILNAINAIFKDLPGPYSHTNVRVNEQDFNNIKRIRDTRGEHWKIISDPEVLAGGVIVQSEHTFVDYTLESRIKDLAESFMSQQSFSELENYQPPVMEQQQPAADTGESSQLPPTTEAITEDSVEVTDVSLDEAVMQTNIEQAPLEDISVDVADAPQNVEAEPSAMMEAESQPISDVETSIEEQSIDEQQIEETPISDVTTDKTTIEQSVASDETESKPDDEAPKSE